MGFGSYFPLAIREREFKNGIGLLSTTAPDCFNSNHSCLSGHAGHRQIKMDLRGRVVLESNQQCRPNSRYAPDESLHSFYKLQFRSHFILREFVAMPSILAPQEGVLPNRVLSEPYKMRSELIRNHLENP